MTESLKHLIDAAVLFVEMVAVVMIIVAVLLAIWNLAVHLIKRSSQPIATELRLQLGQHLVLALEFLIAADILKSILAPTLEDLGMLGGIILIRTVLSVSIAYELRRDGHASSDRSESESPGADPPHDSATV